MGVEVSERGRENSIAEGVVESLHLMSIIEIEILFPSKA